MQRCAGALERVCLPFARHVCSAAQVQLSGCAHHLAGAGALTIWQAGVQRCAGELERVCLPFGRRLPRAVRVHLSGCTYHVAGVCAALRGCTGERVRLPFGRRACSACAGALERVCLPFGRHVRSAARVHLSGWAYHSIFQLELETCTSRTRPAQQICDFPARTRLLSDTSEHDF